MAPRLKGPPPDRRREILDAALQVFSRKGYAAATNKEIAREAGVTAAAIYWYFPSKEELFRAVLADRQTEVLPLFSELQANWAAPPQEVLPRLMNSFVGFIAQERNQALFRILFTEGGRNPEVAAAMQTQILMPALALIVPYFQHQVERGVVKPFDPRLIHSIVGGPPLLFLMMRYIFRLPHVQDIEFSQVIDATVKTLLDGLLVRPDSPHPEE